MFPVTNPEMLQHLAHATPFVPWLAEAAAAIVITGRADISKYWLQDASIASGFIWLSSTELGLGSAFGAIYHAEDADESLHGGKIMYVLPFPFPKIVVL